MSPFWKRKKVNPQTEEKPQVLATLKSHEKEEKPQVLATLDGYRMEIASSCRQGDVGTVSLQTVSGCMAPRKFFVDLHTDGRMSVRCGFNQDYIWMCVECMCLGHTGAPT